jgi:hypothetical protein
MATSLPTRHSLYAEVRALEGRAAIGCWGAELAAAHFSASVSSSGSFDGYGMVPLSEGYGTRDKVGDAAMITKARTRLQPLGQPI